MERIFSAEKTLFDVFIQDLLGMSINLLLALYLVFFRYLFNMGPVFKVSRGVKTLRVNGYLTLTLLTHGNLAVFQRLMKNVDPMSMTRAQPSIETFS